MYCDDCREPCTDPDPLVWAIAREDGIWRCGPCDTIYARLENARGDALEGEKVRPIRWARRRAEVAA